MDPPQGFLSKRAAYNQKPPSSYLSAYFKAMSDPWSPDNPNGYIAMLVAENRLSCDEMQQGLAAHAAAVPPHMLHYQDARGIPELRRSIANMLQATFMKGVAVDPQHLTVLSGVSSVLDLLFHCIAAPGAGVLVTAPYYPAFDNDLKVRDQVVTIPVHLDPQQQEYTTALDAAADAASQAGHPIAALLLTHPANPQGSLFSRQQLASMVAWCLRKQVHCVSDEIYANSVFDESAVFVSTAHVAAQEAQAMEGAELADDLVHILFGFSKDFCAGGLRVGCLLSKNACLNTALDKAGYFASVPGPLQWSLSLLLDDQAWLTGFLATNKRRLRQAHTTLTGALDAAGIPYVPASAAVFVWVDLSAAFSSSGSSSSSNGGSTSAVSGSWQDEDELCRCMADKHRVVLTPGSSFHAARPGWFRICYASSPPESIPAAVKRIVAAMKEQQQAHQQKCPEQN